MKRLQFIILIFIVSINLGAKNLVYPKGFEPKKESQAITFTENKGQVSDQNNKPRPDVLYGGNAKGMVFHLRNDGISYQLNRVDSWKTEDTLFNPHHRMMPGENKKVRDQISIYRIDINWLNCNKNFTLQPDDSLPGYSNYYHEVCPNGVHDVKTYKGVTYKNIYNNIDLHYYEKGGNLKYDYIVAPYTDYKQIQLQIEGAEKITLQKDGSVLIKTALGDIAEDAPIIYQDGAKLQSKWTLKNNILGFEVASYNPAYELIIDPVVRSWGTYYGGIGQDYSYYSNACATDISGNVYFTGQAASSTGTILATSGSHQVMIDGSTDAFLAKFNGNGIRQWGTYYGGSGGEIGYSCALDGSGNVFMAGTTTSSVGTVLSTSGAHQVIHGGGPSLNAQDAFLVKFNNNGVRSWGTYYGGSGNDLGYGCTCDGTGNVFLVGETSTNSGTAIATAASHQPTGAGAFLVKFSGGGVRQWGTYYGQFNWARSCATDATGNVFITGVSYGGTLIATPGSHQPTGIAQDAYLAKFNSSGVRQWGTYYGGAGTEWGLSCSVDPSGNIFMSGITNVNSGTVIATLGCHQPAWGGSNDAFLVKFDNNGVRLWGTYYGGTALEYGESCITNASGDVFLAGRTGSSGGTVIATAMAHQTVLNGSPDFDAFLVKFDSLGVRKWGTYYGGSGGEIGSSCATDIFGNIFLVGITTTTAGGTDVATTGAHQVTHGGGYQDSFLVKFFDNCPLPAPPTNSTLPAALTLCSNNITSLTATGTGTINWYATPTGTMVLGTGTVFTTPFLTQGTYTFYAEDITCAPSASRTAITVTVNPSPTIMVNSGAICSGQSFTINPSGANIYTISGGSSVVSPISSTSYSITGTSLAGCNSAQAVVCNITVHPLPLITASGVSSVCPGESATLNSSGASTYTWSTGANTSSLTVTPSVNTTYTVSGKDANGCSNSASISISVKPLPIVSVSNATICSGEIAVLQTSVSPPSGITYSWLANGQTSSSIGVSPASTSVYSLVVFLDGCKSSASGTVDVVSSITPNTLFSYPGPFCVSNINPSPVLSQGFSPGGIFSAPSGLSINNNTGVVDLSKSSPGTYNVSYVLSASGCRIAGSGNTAVVVTLPVPSELVSSLTIIPGTAVTLSLSGTASYSWSPSAWLSCTNCSSPVASPPHDMEYCVSVPDNLCIAKTCVLVKVDDVDYCSAGVLKVPNAFTPNGDSGNDAFCLQGWAKCVNKFSILIFDRWGEKVFESTDPDFCWDGIYKGKLLESDVFVYMIRADFLDGRKTNKNGNITLIR